MKVKCKTCGKKIQTTEPLECTNGDCQIKYPHKNDVFTFKDYFQPEGNILTDFKTPEPYTTYIQDEWGYFGLNAHEIVASQNVDKDGDEFSQ